MFPNKSNQFSATWWFFNTSLRKAMNLGFVASILLKDLLVSLPKGQESAMWIQELQVSLQRVAEDGKHMAAMKIWNYLDLFRFSSTHSSACEADHGTVHQFEKPFIALELIFCHPICLKEEYKVRDSLNFYVRQCFVPMIELAQKLKLKLVCPSEYHDFVEQDIDKLGRTITPKWDLVFGQNRGVNW